MYMEGQLSPQAFTESQVLRSESQCFCVHMMGCRKVSWIEKWQLNRKKGGGVERWKEQKKSKTGENRDGGRREWLVFELEVVA